MRRLGVLAPAPVPPAPLLLAAPLVDTVPAVGLAALPVPAAQRTRFAHPVRAGPPSALERHTLLMVFHS